MKVTTLFMVAGVVLTNMLAGQPVISTRSGVLLYTEGEVLLAEKRWIQTGNEFPEIKEGEEMRTEHGHAEILLGPDTFLRLDDGTSVRMISNDLAAPSVELIAGSAILEFMKSATVTVTFGDVKVLFGDKGVYRIDASDQLIRVYAGRATITRGRKTLSLQSGQQARMERNTIDAQKFRRDQRDSFLLWAIGRSKYLGMINCFSAARARQETNCTWFYYSPYGAACLPSQSYCQKFLGPLVDIAGR